MKFSEYCSIENVERQKYMDELTKHGLITGMWAVQEKVHGSNFAIYVNDKEIKNAKRTSFMGFGEGKWDAKFYNYPKAVLKVLDKVRPIWGDFKEKHRAGCYGNKKLHVDHIIIYGELCGGNYPHPDVPKMSTSQVQSGIWYSNDVEFLAFDIKIVYESGLEIFIDPFASEILFQDHALTHIPILFSGTLDECLEFSKTTNYAQSMIASWVFGLPAIENNTREGNVIKRCNDVRLPMGGRAIIKYKNEIWKEKAFKPNKGVIKKELEPTIAEMIESASAYLTEARLSNVLSKTGPISSKQFAYLSGLMSQDVIKDLVKDNEEKYLALGENEQKKMRTEVNKLTQDWIRPQFVNILDTFNEA